MMKVADYLARSCSGLKVTVMMSNLCQTEVPPSVHNTIRCDDVVDYYDKLFNMEGVDAFVLGAAVANLMPSDPWKGKFPSHEYSVGEEFDVKFQIAPRIIDRLKASHPRCCLIGYKLFDGGEEQLIKAARKTLRKSRANAIFANTPYTSSSYKIMLTQDGAEIEMTFDQHKEWILRLINNLHYRTEVIDWPSENRWPRLATHLDKLIKHSPRKEVDGQVFGTFALRDGDGFWTTVRGHRREEPVRVVHVDHTDRKVIAAGKATMNAPLLDKIFRLRPKTQVILHGHEVFPDAPIHPYKIPGTVDEVSLAGEFIDERCINIAHHGYVVTFESVGEALEWMDHT